MHSQPRNPRAPLRIVPRFDPKSFLLRLGGPGGDRFPVGIFFGCELAAAGVEDIASGIAGQRMDEQAIHDPAGHFEILAGLFFGPLPGAFGQWLEFERGRGVDVAGDAAGVAGALFQEDRLDFRFVGFVIEGLRGDQRRKQQQGRGASHRAILVHAETRRRRGPQRGALT